jgi:SSS family solute:Na+ symporter
MSNLDWGVLLITLLSIVLYGLYKGRGQNNLDSYLLAGKQLPWYHVLLSVMATQASAITFLSAPGQAYTDGMRFVQFYFGLPLAMIVLSMTFIPMFQKLRVFTAYEFLESRFDHRTRKLTALLFLLQRGVSTGISIYAPSIILSTILKIDIQITTLLIGTLVIVYTAYGGTKAVSYTQMVQMGIIFLGMLTAGIVVLIKLPENVGISTALHIAGDAGRMNVIDLSFDWNNRYTLWSGLVGGFFLQLSYFGTDQSQVGRYLTAHSTKQSRMGLLMNGMLKIPMQFLILLLGILVFAFYQFTVPPVFFNQLELKKMEQSIHQKEFQKLEENYEVAANKKVQSVYSLAEAYNANNESEILRARSSYKRAFAEGEVARKEAVAFLNQKNYAFDKNDGNYIFLSFVMQYLPEGLIGLLIAVIFLASMGSLASGLNSLAAASIIDIYKRSINMGASDKKYLNASRLATLGWGIFCIIAALFAGRVGNLLEAVNVLGSLFYGTILGIFIVAFYVKRIGGKAVFWAAILTESFVVFSWYNDLMAFLWLNVLGCALVVGIGFLIEKLKAKSPNSKAKI